VRSQFAARDGKEGRMKRKTEEWGEEDKREDSKVGGRKRK